VLALTFALLLELLLALLLVLSWEVGVAPSREARARVALARGVRAAGVALVMGAVAWVQPSPYGPTAARPWLS